MSISESSLSHALHGIGHPAHRRSPASRAESFAQQLAQATGQTGTQGQSAGSAGSFLSSDLLQAIQAIH